MAIINGTANKDDLSGTAGDDKIYGYAGNDSLDGGAGADEMDGGAGDDFYRVDHIGDVVIEAADGGEDGISSALAYYVLPANVEDLDFWGITTLVNVHGIGNALDNRLYGRGGNDIVDGGAGADYMYGGRGNDTYYVDHVDDWVEEEDDVGYDTIHTTVVPHAYLHDMIERLIYTGSSNVTITGGWRNNDITTDAGNDMIDGGEGGDFMRGGRGNDVYVIDSNNDHVIEKADEGTDTIRTKLAQQSMHNFVENMVFIGTGDFFGLGNGLANRIEGGAGNDSLYGNGGNDVLVGFGGDDGYWAEDSGDTIIEAADGGWDHVWVTAPSYILPANVENLYIYTAAGVQAVGNALNNQLSGHDGNDSLNGAGGADLMFGGKGDDIYFIEQAGDWAQENAGEGFDTVNYYLHGSYALRANFEKLVYHGNLTFYATGNELDNVIVTGAGNDWLNGMAGADRMEGKGGNDIYRVDHVGDVVVEAAGEGEDTVLVAVGTYTLGANIEHLTLDATWMSLNATGNALNNTISGGMADDILDGGAGADRLEGGQGNDVYVVDNAGDVVVEYAAPGIDEIRTTLGSRTDASKMYVLPENVEKLTGTSATAQGVFANAHDNVVTMGAGGDLIVMWQGGNDIVNGGGGDDYVFYGDTLGVMDVNDGGAGFDTLGLLGNIEHVFTGANMTNFEKLAVYSSGGEAAMPNHYHLTMADANVAAGKSLMVVARSLSTEETLFFDGSAERSGSFNVRGGRGADTVIGGAGADVVWGHLGADTLSGGAGNDVFEYQSAAESSVQNRDTILDFSAGDKINLKSIDADGNAANGNSKFVFIGDNWFSGTRGELRIGTTGEGWLVEADIDGDGSADLAIAVTNHDGHIFSASDFFL